MTSTTHAAAHTTVPSCGLTVHDLAGAPGPLRRFTARFPCGTMSGTVSGLVARHCLGVPLFLADGLDATSRHTAYAVTNILHDLRWDGDADGITDSAGCIADSAVIIDPGTGTVASLPALCRDLVHALGLGATGCVLAGSDPRLAAAGFIPWEHGAGVWWHRVTGDPVSAWPRTPAQ
jgi:hypothetical protein